MRNSADGHHRYGAGWGSAEYEKGQWHSLKCLESGTVLFEAKDGGVSAAGGG